MSGRSGTGRLRDEICDAVSAVEDPEDPGLSIVDLGLLEAVQVAGTRVAVGLIPTFSGCPALAVIAGDVRDAVSRIDGTTEVDVVWLRTPSWSTERLTSHARQILAGTFSVGVQIGSGAPPCPRCGEPTETRSAFGPSRCRAVHTCSRCKEPVEVLRG